MVMAWYLSLTDLWLWLSQELDTEPATSPLPGPIPGTASACWPAEQPANEDRSFLPQL